MPGTLQIPYSTPYETGLKQLQAVGQKAETPDGSIFRYTQMGATLGVANKLYQSSIPIGDWITQVHTVAIVVGDTEISHKTASTTFVANEAAGGTLVLEETLDLGHIYRVKSNIATAGAETIMQLEDGVTVQKEMDVAANNVLTFIKNPWKDVIISPAGINSAPNAGIPKIYPFLYSSTTVGSPRSRVTTTAVAPTGAAAQVMLAWESFGRVAWRTVPATKLALPFRAYRYTRLVGTRISSPSGAPCVADVSCISNDMGYSICKKIWPKSAVGAVSIA